MLSPHFSSPSPSHPSHPRARDTSAPPRLCPVARTNTAEGCSCSDCPMVRASNLAAGQVGARFYGGFMVIYGGFMVIYGEKCYFGDFLWILLVFYEVLWDCIGILGGFYKIFPPTHWKWPERAYSTPNTLQRQSTNVYNPHIFLRFQDPIDAFTWPIFKERMSHQFHLQKQLPSRWLLQQWPPKRQVCVLQVSVPPFIFSTEDPAVSLP